MVVLIEINNLFSRPQAKNTEKWHTVRECRGTHTQGSDNGSGPHPEDAALPVGLEELLGVGLRGIYSHVRGADIHRPHSGHQWWQGIWCPQGESKTRNQLYIAIENNWPVSGGPGGLQPCRQICPGRRRRLQMREADSLPPRLFILRCQESTVPPLHR